MRGERTLSQCNKLIQQYHDRPNGCVQVLEEGVLGLGIVLCYGVGLKTTVITEKYVNPWQSTHTVRMYNKTPKKYLKIIENGI